MNKAIDEIFSSAGFDLLERETPLHLVESALRLLSGEVEDADELRRAAVRVEAVQRLQELNVRSAAKLVDAALKSFADTEAVEAGQGRSIVLGESEPWGEAVNGAELLNTLEETFCRFLILPTGAAATMALWTFHTHLIDAADVSPILCFSSPEKRCGKTQGLEILQTVVLRPLPASNVTPAALFRTVEKFQPTMLVDEADTFLKNNEDLRGLLNSGHRRATASIIRIATVGDDLEPRVFSTWGPKAIALIGSLPATLADRAIILPMRRKGAGEIIERIRFEELMREMVPIREKLTRWANDNLEKVKRINPEPPASLNDRAADNWRPLLSIAATAGGDWEAKAIQAALTLSGPASEADTSARVQLIHDLKELFEKKAADRLSSAEIVNHLGELEDRPWPEWKKGKPISQTQLARILKPFGVKPKQLRIGEKTRGYELADLQDCFSRYSEVVQAVQPNQGAGLSTVSDPVQEQNCTTSTNSGNPHGDCIVPGVPDRQGVLAEKQEEIRKWGEL